MSDLGDTILGRVRREILTPLKLVKFMIIFGVIIRLILLFAFQNKVQSPGSAHTGRLVELFSI